MCNYFATEGIAYRTDLPNSPIEALEAGGTTRDHNQPIGSCLPWTMVPPFPHERSGGSGGCTSALRSSPRQPRAQNNTNQLGQPVNTRASALPSSLTRPQNSLLLRAWAIMVFFGSARNLTRTLFRKKISHA
jgi:hypothetical protein